jgi:hypothetical protein
VIEQNFPCSKERKKEERREKEEEVRRTKTPKWEGNTRNEKADIEHTRDTAEREETNLQGEQRFASFHSLISFLTQVCNRCTSLQESGSLIDGQRWGVLGLCYGTNMVIGGLQRRMKMAYIEVVLQ